MVAVSPPIGLLFSPEAAQGIQARVRLVSGSRDWAVPPDPEALASFSQSPALGHQMGLANGGDHFNWRAPAKASTPALPSPLIRAWVNGTFAAGANAQPAAGAPSLFPATGWGSSAMPLVEVTTQQAAGASTRLATL